MASEVTTLTRQLTKLQQMTAEVLRHIRWSTELNKGSVYDVIQVITGHNSKNAAEYFYRLKTQHPEVSKKCGNHKFPGKGQRETPVADAATLVEIAYLCPGKAAAQFRRQGAELLCRHLAEDLSLIDEIVAKHKDIDTDVQEKLLSGTSSTPEQANAVPETFKRITESHVLFKQPMLYMGRYKELDGQADTIKIGQSTNVIQRVKSGDQADRLFWQYLIPMPNQKTMDCWETSLKKFAKEQDILAKKEEYIDPFKFGLKLGSNEQWSASQAMAGLVGMMSPLLEEGQQILKVNYCEIPNILETDWEGIPLADPVKPTKQDQSYEIVPSKYGFVHGLNELPFFNELTESLKKWLSVTAKENRKLNRNDVLELEREREITKRLEIETRAKEMDLVLELAKLGKSAEETRAYLDLVASSSKSDDKIEGFSRFLRENIVKDNGHSMKVSDLAKFFIEWAREHFKDVVSEDPRKYSPRLTELLAKEPWFISKRKTNKTYVYDNISMRR